MPVLLACAASVAWGVTDYVGGVARRGMSVLAVVSITQFAGVLVLLPALVVCGWKPLGDPRLLLAAVAGVGVTLELALVFVALSRGDAFITAPVGALGSAIAVSIGLLEGDPLGLGIGLGLFAAVVSGAACVAASADFGDGRRQRSASGPLISGGAASGVAVALIGFHAASSVNPVWATAVEHFSAALSAGLVELAAGAGRFGSRLPERTQMLPLLLLLAAGMLGDLAYAFASRRGALSVVSAVSSLYPVTTMALAVVFQGRRASRLQAVSVAFAIAGGVLLGLATG